MFLGMADLLMSAEFLQLAESHTKCVAESASNRTADVAECIAVLRTLNRSKWQPITEKEEIRRVFNRLIVQEVSSGCWSQELASVVEYLDETGSMPDALFGRLRSALENFMTGYHLADEMADCSSSTQCNELATRLQSLGERLGLDVTPELAEVMEKKEQFEEEEDIRADMAMDDWKDEWSARQDTEDEIRGLFATLAHDRD